MCPLMNITITSKSYKIVAVTADINHLKTNAEWINICFILERNYQRNHMDQQHTQDGLVGSIHTFVLT
jgi:hypothetical protein